MAGFNVDRRGIDSIMKGFELYSKGAKHYSVWQGKNMKFQSSIEDDTLLHDNLEALLDCDSDALMTIRFHKTTEKDNFVTDKTPYISSFNFKVSNENKTKQLGTIGGDNSAYGNPILGKLEQILQNQNQIESRLNALEEPEEEEEEAELKQPGLLGVIETFAATEPGQAMITNIIGAMINKFLPLQNQPIMKQTTGIAGVGIPTNEEKIENAIERLKNVDNDLGNHLQKLAQIAENKPDTFKMLLGMLNNF